MAKIKICGLIRVQDIEAVNEVLPDYIGFVFAESFRRVNHSQAKEMKRLLDERIRAVGVFVNTAQSEIVKLCNDGVIDLVQLHGDEDDRYISELKALIPNPVIKAVRVQSTRQLLQAELLPCDFLLLDTYQKDAYGGSGKSFDRSLIPKLTKPFFLAGGLHAENVAEAIEDCHPYCVDISSGVETDKMKDYKKIKEIVGIVRSER